MENFSQVNMAANHPPESLKVYQTFVEWFFQVRMAIRMVSIAHSGVALIPTDVHILHKLCGASGL